jgi:hypothetical protein
MFARLFALATLTERRALIGRGIRAASILACIRDVAECGFVIG